MEHLFLVFKVTAWRSPVRISEQTIGGAGRRAGLFRNMLCKGGELWTSTDTLDGNVHIRRRYTQHNAIQDPGNLHKC